MKKRILSILLACCMILSMLPVSAFEAKPTEALYAQMLELGLVDANGALIEDNTFTLEDGTRLMSLTELINWLNQCEKSDLDTSITVDATGRTATAEQLMQVLLIEYQMADLAQGLEMLASGANAVPAAAANGSVDTAAHDIKLSPTIGIDGSILTLEVVLVSRDDESTRVQAPHDIKVNVGMFADFLAAHDEDYAVNGSQVPGTNYFKDFTIPAGSSSIEFRMDMQKLRANYLSQYDGLWDGNAYMLFQARTAPYDAQMPASSFAVSVSAAPRSGADPIVGKLTGGIEIGRKVSGGTSVQPYHLDWSQNDSATEKVTIGGTDYFKIGTAVPAAKGFDYSSDGMSYTTHGWMKDFNRALELGVGDTDDPKVKLENVTIWTKESYGSYPIGFPSLYIMEGGDLVEVAESPFTYRWDDFADGSRTAAYLADLTRVQSTNWELSDSEAKNQNFYKKIKDHSWNLARFTSVEIPIAYQGYSYVWSYPTDWYLNADWIKQNKDADLRPEELLMHGALTLADKTAPAIESIDTCARVPKYEGSTSYYYDSFYPGDTVPIVVTFSEPVYGDYQLAYLEGTEVRYLPSGTLAAPFESDLTSSAETLSKTRVFYYHVGSTDCTEIQVLGVKPVDEDKCTDLYGNKFKASTDGDYKEFPATILDVEHICGGRLEQSFDTMSAEVDPQDPRTVRFTVELWNFETFQTKWLEWSKDENAQKATVVLDGDTAQSVELTLDVAGTGSSQKYILTGTMTLPETGTDTAHVAELYFGNSLCYGIYTTFTQKALVYAGADAYTIGIDGDWPSGAENTVFVQDAKMPVLRFESNQKDYTYNYLGTDDVKWTVDNTDVVELVGSGTDLSLTQTGTVSVVPLKAGTATISLVCGNNGTRQTTASNTITVTVKDSGSPTLLFPQGADTIYARIGTDQTVHFASNLSQHEPADGKITARLYEGSSVAAGAAAIWETTLERSAGSLIIPGEKLSSISRGDTASYILRLTATAQVNSIDRQLSTDAKIVVRSQPAAITLTGLDAPTFVSGQSITIGWSVENFDLTTNPEECQFAFRIEKAGREVYSTTEKSASGSYTLTPETPAGLKDYYVVTVKAKNGADPTWSIASSTMTVYRAGALDILIGGEKKDSVTLKNEITGGTTTAPSGTTYAGKAIGGLTSAQAIAGLRSELSLMESIGINFEEYDWSILYDTIQWSTSTGQGNAISDELQRAVSVNYREGSLYAPLEQYSYTSYLPQTILLLCGLRDGSNTITATHSALSSLSDSVTVNVETLKNKLYLFQFTPAARTEVSYEDALGKTHTVYSNDDGSLALFEPNAIASELRAASVSGNTSYRGTVLQLSLKSGEGNGTRGELYPLNTVELRRAAAAQVQLLKPDGTPLANTSVTLRGGVYRNRYAADNRDDAYCAGAKFAKAAGQAAALDGTTDQTFTTDASGLLTVHMDLSQFTSKNDPAAVGVGDSLEFIFELRFGGGYYPEIVIVDGSLTQRDAMRSGEDIVTLTAAQKAKPFVAVQTVSYTGREIDVRRHTGVVGPSSNYPSAVLSSTVMLWGVEDASLTDTGYHFDLRAQETAVCVPRQKQIAAKDASYPFSSIPIVSNVVTINTNSFADYDAARKTPLEAALYSGSGGLRSTIALPFGLADLTAIEKVEDAPSVMSLMANLAAYGSVGGANTEYGIVNSVSDGIMKDALSLLEEMGGETGLVKAILLPTEDPTRYEAYLWTGINTTKLEDLNYDQNGISLEPTYIGQDSDNLIGQVNDIFTLSDFQAMADGSYFDDRSGLYGAASGAIGMPVMLQLEGWISTEIRYSFDKGQWQVLTTGGGFTAGAQLEFERILNLRPYGFPVTASFKVRGGAVVDFKTAIRYAEQLGLEWNDDTANAVNDYLTALRINAYFEFFGGVGYDKGFTAKVGVFGSIEINNENRFLTRSYLKDPSKKDVRGQYLQLDGEAGVRMALGVGPVVTEITLVSLGFSTSWRFNDWEAISDYWEEASSGLGSTGWMDGGLNGQSGQKLLYDNGETAVVAAAPLVKLQSRDYLAEGGRSWPGGGIALMSMDGENRLSGIQTNAYPFSMPMISDDGSMLVYLSDADSTDVTRTEVRYSLSNGGSFPDGTAIPDGADGFSGYGDSALAFDGTADFAGAVWLREAATVGLRAGTELTEAQQISLLGGLEVVASIWNGHAWTTTRLTSNGSQEFDPVIAVGGGKAIAVWRSVQTGESAYSFTQNRILCKIFDGTGWSDAYTLYNGSAGEVTGMSAEMLADGTAAIAFSIDDAHDGSDIYYIVADTNAENLEDSAKTIRATTNTDADEDPQLIGVGDRFVLGWSSVQSLTGAEQHDVGLRVFDKTGAPQPILPESLSDMVSTAAFDGTFTFVKGADSLDALSLLWNDAGSGSAENDVLRAIKFVSYGNSYLSSAAIEVAELPARTGLDHMDACVTNSDGTGIQAVIQGTTYSDTEFDTVSYSYELDGETYTGTGRIPKQTVNLYSAAETYTDAIKVVSTTVDYTTLAADSYVPVSFTVSNQGMHVIESLTVRLTGAQAQTFSGLTLLPGQTKTVSAVTRTGSVIEDLSYTVEASAGGQRCQDSGTVYLDYPDVGISALTVTREQDGLRTMLASLYNQSAASLARSDRRVVLSVYSDPECQMQLDGKYFSGGTPDSAYELILTGNTLSSIDSTGYTQELTFDIGGYVKDAGLKEIPESNVMLFVKARIEQLTDGAWLALPEADSQNNQRHVVFDSLLIRNENAPTTLSVEMENGETTTASVQVRNNSLQPHNGGNLVAALLDQDGKLLETKNIGDLTLAGEEVAESAITFSRSGARVVLRYAEAGADGSSNANAASITIDGLPLTLDSFDENDTATLDGVPAGRYLLTVIPESANATVSVNRRSVENGMAAIACGYYKQAVYVTITSADGSAARTYTIYLNPPASAGSDVGEQYTLTFETNGGSKLASLRKNAGTTVDLTAYKPTRSGYSFAGWYADKALTEKTTSVKLTGNMTVYAAWQRSGTASFVDVPAGSYYEEAVNWAVGQGITSGTTATTFSPDEACTRAQAVTFLWRAAGSPKPVSSVMPFTDVAESSYYHDAVLWAVEQGITVGTSAAAFSPDARCTRAQIVTFLWRSQNSPAASTANPFRDVADDAYYVSAVLWAVRENITKGTSAAAFSPDTDCTRAQIVTFIWRAMAQ